MWDFNEIVALIAGVTLLLDFSATRSPFHHGSKHGLHTLQMTNQPPSSLGTLRALKSFIETYRQAIQHSQLAN